MSPVRQSAPGTTRVCPHCRQTILESAAVCPGCRHHLRFDPNAKEREKERAGASETPLRVEGVLQHPATSGPWEYSVLLTIRNERGEEVTRHVAGVGALSGTERRSFTLAVEIFKPETT